MLINMMIFRDQYCILNTLTSTYLVTYTHQMKCTQKHVHMHVHMRTCMRTCMHTYAHAGAHAHLCTCACAQCLHLIEYIYLLGLGLHRLFPFVLILPMYYLIVVFANTRRSLMQCWHRLFQKVNLEYFLKSQIQISTFENLKFEKLVLQNSTSNSTSTEFL